MDDSNRNSRLSGTSSSAAAMVVDVIVVGKAVADDVGEVVNVKATCRNVGGNQQLKVAFTEFFHHGIALSLREVAMQGIGIVAVLNELRRHLLGTCSSAAKDNAIDAGQVVYNALERVVLVAGLDHIIYVSHIGRTLIADTGDKFHRVVHVILGYVGNLTRHGGAEKQHFALLGHMAQNLVDVIDKAHVEHLVGLVENDGPHFVEFHHATANQVLQTAWRGDNNLHTLLYRLDLWLNARAAIYCQHSQAVYKSGIILQVGLGLQAEFAGGVED